MGKINKWLCEWIDEENKGYVTIGNFLGFVVFISILSGFFYIVLYSVFKFIFMGAFWATNEASVYSLQIFGGAVICLLLLFIAIFLILTTLMLIEYILEIKIAKCELKEKKKND